MVVKDFEIYLQKINSELFSFSYTLVPDDLQAQQIVIDSVCVLSFKDKELLNQLFSIKDKKTEGTLLLKVKKSLYCHIFDIGKKRFNQLANGIEHSSKFSAFYSLSMDQKAVLFLKYKTTFDLSDIEDIVNLGNLEVISILNCARDNLLQCLGKETPINEL